MYDNVPVRKDSHIYENVWELHNATPDLIRALNPRVPIEEEEEEEELQKQVNPLKNSHW